MKVVLLAAGMGKRMNSVTELIPKPLLPINGIPIIDSFLLNISKLGFSEVTIVINHLSNLIIEYCGNGSKYNINIKYIFQEKPDGTGSAVKKALNNEIHDVMIIGGDTFFSFDHYKKSIETYRKSNADGLIILKKVSKSIITKTSLVSLNEDNFITNFIEKPKLHQVDGNIGSALFHIYNKSFVKYLADISLSERSEYELTEATKKMIEDNKKIIGLLMVSPLDLTDVKDLLIHNFSYINKILKKG